MKKIEDAEITDAIFDYLLAAGLNFLPQLKQIRKFGKFEISNYKKTIDGIWLFNIISRTGGANRWRQELKLMDEEQYTAAIKKWRDKHGSNPYAGEEVDGEHVCVTRTA